MLPHAEWLWGLSWLGRLLNYKLYTGVDSSVWSSCLEQTAIATRVALQNEDWPAMKFHTNHVAYISITVFSYTTYHQRTTPMRIKIITRATAPATAMPTIAPVDSASEGPPPLPPEPPEPPLPLPDSPLPELALTANTKHKAMKACSIIHPSYSYSTDREIITSNVPHSVNAAYRHTATQTPMVNGWLQLYGYKALCAADGHVEFARLPPLHDLIWRVHASCDSFATVKGK